MDKDRLVKLSLEVTHYVTQLQIKEQLNNSELYHIMILAATNLAFTDGIERGLELAKEEVSAKG